MPSEQHSTGGYVLMTAAHNEEAFIEGTIPVSYTHLDVYKRQVSYRDVGHCSAVAPQNPIQ